MVVSKSETSVLVLSKSMVGTNSRICLTTSQSSIISAVLKASTALAPQPFLSGVRKPLVVGKVVSSWTHLSSA